MNCPLNEMDLAGTNQVVGWAGAIFQMPHKAIYQQLKTVPKGVLCSIVFDGSPAQLYGLHPLTWVTDVNDTPISDLESFLQVVSKIPSDSFARVKVVSYNRFVKVISIRTNTHYFGSWQIKKNESADSGWDLATF